MGLQAEWVAVDTQDPEQLARFWLAALGWELSTEPQDDGEDEIFAPSDRNDAVRRLLFLKVPETKKLKNRLHLDLRPDDQQAEIERLLTLGAAYADVRQSDAESLVVLADPEGNEFCVLRAIG